MTSIALVLASGCASAEEGPEPPLPLGTHVDDWRDEVVYQLMVDRFDDAESNEGDARIVPGDLSRFQGGDWEGVRRRLDYVQALGATAIWISPVVENAETDPFAAREDAYHGYWGRDFTRPNPHYGTERDLARLVAECHDRGLLVIVDVVLNHVGPLFYYDADADHTLGAGEAEPPFSAVARSDVVWLDQPELRLGPPIFRFEGPPTVFDDLASFHRRGTTGDFDRQDEVELGDFPTGLRDLDTENERVRRALVETYTDWILRFDLDGFRIDTVPHVSVETWRALATAIRARLAETAKRRFLLLGEVFTGDDARAARYTNEGALDANLWFGLKFGVIDGVLLEGQPTARFGEVLAARDAAYDGSPPHPDGIELSPRDALVAFADNHDVPRVLGDVPDERVLRLALVMVFALDAIPAVYYGTEQGFAGGFGHAARAPMFGAFDEGHPLFRFIARLAALRAARSALRFAPPVVRFESTISGLESGPGAGMLAWERGESEDRVLVVMNAHAFDEGETRDEDGQAMRTGFPPGTELVDLLVPPGETARRYVAAVDGELVVRLGPREVVMLGVVP